MNQRVEYATVLIPSLNSCLSQEAGRVSGQRKHSGSLLTFSWTTQGSLTSKIKQQLIKTWSLLMALQENLAGEGKRSFESSTVWKNSQGNQLPWKQERILLRQEINKPSANASALVLIGENLNLGRRSSFLIYETITAPLDGHQNCFRKSSNKGYLKTFRHFLLSISPSPLC